MNNYNVGQKVLNLEKVFGEYESLDCFCNIIELVKIGLFKY